MKKLLGVLVVIAVSACAHAYDRKDTSCQCDGGTTEALPGTNTVVVKISLDEKGMPMVDFDAAVVKWGQRIIWVGPEEMVIRFPEGSPFRESKLYTKDAVINMVVPQQKKEEVAYKYDVIVGKQVLDPKLIVRAGQVQ